MPSITLLPFSSYFKVTLIVDWFSPAISSNDFIYPSLNNMLAIANLTFDAGISTVLCFAVLAFLILVNISAIGSVVTII